MIAGRHGLVLSPTLAAMLDDPAIQAVVLATPHALHRAEIEAVADAGKPVFCGRFRGRVPVGEERADGDGGSLSGGRAQPPSLRQQLRRHAEGRTRRGESPIQRVHRGAMLRCRGEM
jgi:hypothetical protein